MTSPPGSKPSKNSRTGSDPQVRASFSNQLTEFMSVTMVDTTKRPGIKYEDFVSGVIDALVRVSKDVPNGMGLAVLQVLALELTERVNGDLYVPGVVDGFFASEASAPRKKKNDTTSHLDIVPDTVDTSAITKWEYTGSLNDESPLHRLGYSVADGGLSEEERRAVLANAFIAKNLPGVTEKSQIEQWGGVSSAQRLYVISKFVAWLANFQGKDKPAAQSKWASDLAWLKGSFYQKGMRFEWPKPFFERIPNPEFMIAMTPSAALAAVIGNKPMPRTEVVKQLWVYIKKNKLQDAINKRMINADAKLKMVFGKTQVSMFEMADLIGKNLK